MQELFAKDGLLDEFKKALSKRMLAAEPADHGIAAATFAHLEGVSASSAALP